MTGFDFGREVLGLERHGFPEASLRLCIAALGKQRHPEMIVRTSEVAVEPNRPLETLQRFVGALRVQQRHAKIAVRFRIAGQ